MQKVGKIALFIGDMKTAILTLHGVGTEAKRKSCSCKYRHFLLCFAVSLEDPRNGRAGRNIGKHILETSRGRRAMKVLQRFVTTDIVKTAENSVREGKTTDNDPSHDAEEEKILWRDLKNWKENKRKEKRRKSKILERRVPSTCTYILGQ